ncbi:MAG: doubled motif LPXTG anchor domain-containing protein, partial [Enterocloster asparagiformis]|nr:doubled motif LPXTG anchor domain-containing protein [Enterocloster asparagiformis]
NYLEKDTNKVLKAADTRTNKTFGESYKETAPEISGYSVVGSGEQSIVLDAYNKEITFFYIENENIIVNYQSEDLTKGTVTLDNESIAPATGAPKGSEAKPADGYVFTHWTNSNGETVATGENNKHYTPVKNPATEVFESDTYTAHFTERGDLSYKVEYYFDGKLGETVAQDNVKFGTDIAYTTTDRTYNNQNYVFEKTEGPKTVGADSEQNLLKVYYTLDATGIEKPGTPDGIPDKFQITIKYESNANGSVGGTTVEVHTIQDFERDAQTGEIITVGPVRPATPNANVTTTANSRYTFDYWSIRGNADKKYSSTDDLTKEAFTEDVTFAANFRYVGGGSSSGGGGPSGGGGSHSAKPETGGPGALTTINQDEVPLAIMPDLTSADLTVIDDGEVPFAALPKTGQSSVKGTLTMMMSGILLALVALNKKRKEEDNS